MLLDWITYVVLFFICWGLLVSCQIASSRRSRRRSRVARAPSGALMK